MDSSQYSYKYEDEEDAYYKVMNAQQPIIDAVLVENQNYIIITTAQGTVQIWDYKDEAIIAQYDNLEEIVQPIQIEHQILIVVQTLVDENRYAISIHHWRQKQGDLHKVAQLPETSSDPVRCVLLMDKTLYTGSEGGVIAAYCCKDLFAELTKANLDDMKAEAKEKKIKRQKKRMNPY
jgi:hypothetical protein